MKTNMTGFSWISIIFHRFALDQSGLSIGRVEPRRNYIVQFIFNEIFLKVLLNYLYSCVSENVLKM